MAKTLRPRRIEDDPCELARRWLLDATLAEMLVRLDRMARERFAATGIGWPGLWIISGFRSKEDQARLNPSAPQSLHTRCPSLAVDLRLGSSFEGRLPGDDSIWQILGGMWQFMGGRWGGSFRDPDLNHFDLGV